MEAKFFYPQGTPVGTTWVQIEDADHKIGKLMATEFDQSMKRQHAEDDDQTHPVRSAANSADRWSTIVI